LTTRLVQVGCTSAAELDQIEDQGATQPAESEPPGRVSASSR
jgi:hypothetical protein